MSDELKDEINDMLGGMLPGDEVEEVEEVEEIEEEGQEEVIEEVVKEEEIVEDETIKEKVEESEEVIDDDTRELSKDEETEVKEIEDKVDEVEEIITPTETSTERELRLENEALKKQVEANNTVIPVEEIKAKTVEELVKDIGDPQDLIEDPAKFATFILELSQTIKGSATEAALASTPEVVSRFVDKSNQLQAVRDKFFKDNPELAKIPKYVSTIANEITAENPDKTVNEVLELTSERAYKALELEKEVSTENKNSSRKKPAFAKPRGGSKRKEVPKLSGLQADIDSIIEY